MILGALSNVAFRRDRKGVRNMYGRWHPPPILFYKIIYLGTLSLTPDTHGGAAPILVNNPGDVRNRHKRRSVAALLVSPNPFAPAQWARGVIRNIGIGGVNRVSDRLKQTDIH